MTGEILTFDGKYRQDHAGDEHAHHHKIDDASIQPAGTRG
jgi:hypothetical protein